jgi:hypothetical protein
MLDKLKKCGRCKESKPYSSYEKDDIFLKTGDKLGLTYYCINCLNVERERISGFRDMTDRQFKESIQNERMEKERYRRNSDPLFKLLTTLRVRTFLAFKAKGWRKGSKTREMMGCDMETAKMFIEAQFDKGMTWDNHGEWHIDHKIPLSYAANDSELAKLCHYTNLQPLWAGENIKKKDKHPHQLPIII